MKLLLVVVGLGEPQSTSHSDKSHPHVCHIHPVSSVPLEDLTNTFRERTHTALKFPSRHTLKKRKPSALRVDRQCALRAKIHQRFRYINANFSESRQPESRMRLKEFPAGQTCSGKLFLRRITSRLLQCNVCQSWRQNLAASPMKCGFSRYKRGQGVLYHDSRESLSQAMGGRGGVSARRL